MDCMVNHRFRIKKNNSIQISRCIVFFFSFCAGCEFSHWNDFCSLSTSCQFASQIFYDSNKQVEFIYVKWIKTAMVFFMQSKAHCTFNFISLWLSINLNRTLSPKQSHIVSDCCCCCFSFICRLRENQR